MNLRLLFCASLILGGCASTQEGQESDEARPARPLPGEERILAPTAQDVRTVQLYREGDEAAPPILNMRSSQGLILQFDLMGNDSRPVSVYFYHADRSWRRDLVPGEYLSSFHRDDILDYRSSRATHVPYVHYRYAFPNESIDFSLSGNYVLRVTEQGMEEDVLFERQFYVSEQTAPLDFGLSEVRIAGEPFPATQPSVRFTPPDQSTGTAFDYTVCFLRNGRLASGRCTDRPALDVQPALRYYLEPESSFRPEPSDYFIDLSQVRVGGRIERTDLIDTPYLVVLEPDYFRFPGTALAPLQNGQIVVDKAVTTIPEPGTGAEYVRVRFSLVPDNEVRVPGRVRLAGGFNDWRPGPEWELGWVEDMGRYEGTVLLKQGRYEYRYAFSDPSVARALVGASPRFDNVITTFVYRDDIRVGTDRLISALSVVAR